jgi:hypothetical protein
MIRHSTLFTQQLFFPFFVEPFPLIIQSLLAIFCPSGASISYLYNWKLKFFYGVISSSTCSVKTVVFWFFGPVGLAVFFAGLVGV